MSRKNSGCFSSVSLSKCGTKENASASSDASSRSTCASSSGVVLRMWLSVPGVESSTFANVVRLEMRSSIRISKFGGPELA